jgi:hypothetical protein
MSDLQSKSLIVAKGLLFLAIGAIASALILFQSPTAVTAILLVLLVWSAARFYYFLFYVLERYVDPSLRYAGIIALVRAIFTKKR